MEEQAATAALSPPALAIVGDGLTHVMRQGQPFTPVALAGHNELTCAPVDIVDAERGHLSGPQTQTRQQRQNREVAAA